MPALTKKDMQLLAQEALYALDNDHGDRVRGVLEMISTGKRNAKGTGAQKPKEERKPNAYNKFVSEYVLKIKAEEPELNSGDRLKKACKLWKTASEQERAKFAVMAAGSEDEEQDAKPKDKSKKGKKDVPATAPKAVAKGKGKGKKGAEAVASQPASEEEKEEAPKAAAKGKGKGKKGTEAVAAPGSEEEKEEVPKVAAKGKGKGKKEEESASPAAAPKGKGKKKEASPVEESSEEAEIAPEDSDVTEEEDQVSDEEHDGDETPKFRGKKMVFADESYASGDDE